MLEDDSLKLKYFLWPFTSVGALVGGMNVFFLLCMFGVIPPSIGESLLGGVDFVWRHALSAIWGGLDLEGRFVLLMWVGGISAVVLLLGLAGLLIFGWFITLEGQDKPAIRTPGGWVAFLLYYPLTFLGAII